MRKGKKALLMLISSISTAALMASWPYGSQTEVETTMIQSGDLIQTTLLNGTVCYAEEQTYFSLKEGVVSEVFVVPGQPIREGELLIKMDTTEEEKALAKLYEAKSRQHTTLESLEEVAALAIQKDLMWAEQEAKLRTAIELSYLRAQADGVMDAVYVQKGQMVAGSTLLGISRGEGIQIVAEASALKTERVRSGSVAAVKNGSKEAAIILKRISAGVERGKQTLVFELMDDGLTQEFRLGETVSIELVTEIYPQKALIPFAAIDLNEMIWVVEDGKAWQQRIVLDELSQEYAGVDQTWAGKCVILRPDWYDLKDGMTVRVNK